MKRLQVQAHTMANKDRHLVYLIFIKNKNIYKFFLFFEINKGGPIFSFGSSTREGLYSKNQYPGYNNFIFFIKNIKIKKKYL